MALLGLVMAPWANMLSHQCPSSLPRLLADDLLVTTVGIQGEGDQADHADDHQAAVQATIDYVYALGSSLSARKCVTLAESAEVRSLHRRHVYDVVGVSFR
eukprot:861889-Alexandrium_andersonii.AAC.1